MKRVVLFSLILACSLYGQTPDQNQVAQGSHNRALPATPYDWKAEYESYYPERPLSDNNQYMTEEFDPCPSNGMAYAMGRFALNGLVYAYRSTKDIKYLNEAKDQISTMFSGTWFKDGTNGAADGLLGWGYNRSDGLTYLANGIPQGSWKTFRIKVEDSSSITKITLTVDGQDLIERTYTGDAWHLPQDPYTYQAGTVVLLSGWARTSFRNIVVKDLSGTTLYDLDERAEFFSSDWQPVRNEDPTTYPNDTGEWTFDEEKGIIDCDATANTPSPFYYPYSSGDADNFGIAASGAANGKYAALVLTYGASSNWRGYTVDGQIKLVKRNGGTSEQGVGVRCNASNSNNLLKGARYHSSLPNNHPTNGETGLRNYHFENYATHLASLFFPAGVRIANDNSWFNGFPSWWGGVTSGLLTNNKYYEFAMYENSACTGILEFIYTVYQDNVTSLTSYANDFLIKIQNNMVAKWYPKINTNSSSDFIVGGRTNLTFDGDRNAAATIGDLARTNLLYSGMYKIARDFNTQWNNLTNANQSPYLPDSSTLYQFYHDQTYNTARYIISRMWSYSGGDYYQFWGLINAPGEFSTWGTDLNHAGMVVFYLAESYHHGFVTKAEMEALARTFTECIWNQNSTENNIDFSVDINGYGSAISNTNSTAQNADFFILLSEVNFKVWEIFDTWLQSGWESYKGWSYYSTPHRYSSIHPALMLYATKFGMPRNVHLSAAANNSVTLGWSHPSTWSGGTRLAHYNVYRREVGQAWPPSPLTSLNTTQLSYTDNTLQSNKTYEYMVRSQDRTSGVVIESDPSTTLTVQDVGGKIVLTGNITADQNFGGSFLVQSNLNVLQGVTLTLQPGTTLYFSDNNANLNVYGTLLANGTSSTINFTSLSGTSPNSWGAIVFDGSGSASSVLDNIVMQYGGEIQCRNGANITVENSTLQNNNNGVYTYYANPTIFNNTIQNNEYHGVISDWSSASIQNNTISKDASHYYHANCGIWTYGSSPFIAGNTIQGFGYGLYPTDNSSPRFYIGYITTPYPNNRVKDNLYGLVTYNSCYVHMGIYNYMTDTYDGGNNGFDGNTYDDIYVFNESTVDAEGNWWGTDEAPLAWVQDGSYFDWDYPIPGDQCPWGSSFIAVQKGGEPITMSMSAHKSPVITLGQSVLPRKHGFKDDLTKAFMLRKLERYSDAMELYKKLLAGEDSFKPALIELANMFTETKNNAIPQFFTGLEADTKTYPLAFQNRPVISQLLASMFIQQGEYSNAKQVCDYVITQFSGTPDERQARFQKFYLALHLDKDKEATIQLLNDITSRYTDGEDVEFAKYMFTHADFSSSGKVNSSRTNSSLALSKKLDMTHTPEKFELSANYPNPFNPSTTIRYAIPENNIVTLKVYDVLGKEVITLVNEEKPIGFYEVQFDATRFSSGIYFYEIQAGSFHDIKKMLLLK